MSSTATRPQRKVTTHLRPATFAMVAPAVRCLAVEVWHVRPERFATTAGPDANGNWPDVGPDWKAYPVLALILGHEHEFNRRAGDSRPEVSPDPERMESLGWHYAGLAYGEVDALIDDGEHYGGIGPASLILSADNVAWRLVSAPWPESEDAARLGPIVAELRKQAREKVERDERLRGGLAS